MRLKERLRRVQHDSFVSETGQFGFTLSQFNQLLPKFEIAYRQKEYERIPEEKRKRKIGGGRKSKLDDITGKLFFILFYYRNYPTLRFAQVLFEIEDCAIWRWVIFLSSVLKETLGYQIPLPERKMRSFSDLYAVPNPIYRTT